MGRGFLYKALILTALVLFMGSNVALAEGETSPQIALANVIGVGPGEIRSIAASPDGAWLAIRYRTSISILNVGTGKVCRVIPAGLFPDAYGGVTFSPDSRFLAVQMRLHSYGKDTIKFLDSKKDWSTTDLQWDDFELLTYSADASLLIGFHYTNLSFWDVKEKKFLKEIETRKGSLCNAAAVSADRSLLALGYENVIYLIDLRHKELLRVLRGHTGPITALAINPKNKGKYNGNKRG